MMAFGTSSDSVDENNSTMSRESSLERVGAGRPGRRRRSSMTVGSGGSVEDVGIEPRGETCEATLVLGNFQGIVVLDMRLVKVGEGKVATLRIEAPEDARKPVTTVGLDPKHRPGAGGLEVNIDREISISRGEHHVAEVSWRPENPGRFRSSLSFRVDGRFPAQVSVVGEAVAVDADRRKKGDGRDGRKRGITSIGGGWSVEAAERPRSLSREPGGGRAERSSICGKENRLSLSTTGLPGATSTSSMMGSTALLRSSADSALTQTAANKRQQMLRYSASRRLSLRPPTNQKGKSAKDRDGNPEGSKKALMCKSLTDKDWAEKQAAGFTNWLNFTLGGAEKPLEGAGSDNDDQDSGEHQGDVGVGGGAAGGGGGSPLKAMMAMRHEARQRMKAMCLFRSAEMRALSDAITLRAADGTISLRRDRVLHADVGLSSALMDLVLSYEPRWLLLGLETVFGEIVPMPASGAGAKGSRLNRALRTFVGERLVKCPDIKVRFGFRGRMASGRSEVEYNEELSRHTLRKFLDLVLFLDRAKAENLLHPCPCLFRKTAEVKSSVGMLKVFCQFMHGEGDFVRHLKKMHYVVTHVQSYIDEFDFHVSNLAVDLRDGVRLTRLVEIVTGEWGLASGLRVPAGSRLQKVFNTGLALATLERDGVTSASAAAKVTAKDVVDGDRHATLRLLWAIIARYSLSALLDRDALVREAEGVVSAARKWGRAGYSSPAPAGRRRSSRSGGAGIRALALHEGWAGGEVAGGEEELQEAPSPPPAGLAVAGTEHPPLAMPDVEAMRAAWGAREGGGGDGGGGAAAVGGGQRGDEELLSALLVWCQAICHVYGVPVRNFTSSFADGRALCLLLHYYHPRILPLSAIRRTTAHLARIGNGGGALEDWSSTLDAAQVTEADCKTALDGERANVHLARRCVEELGGVPSMLAPFDSTNRPEEKTIITVVAHLCARLLESSAEIRATILVQRSYRAYLERTGRGDLLARARAAKAEARAQALSDRIAREAAAAEGGGGAKVETLDPCTPPARDRGRRPSAPALASPELNVYVSGKQQAHVAAVTIQQWWVKASGERLRRLGADAAATVVQSAWRGRAARAARVILADQRAAQRRGSKAAEIIQAIVRGRSQRNAFLLFKASASAIQVWVRGRLQRRWYLAFQSQVAKVVLIQALIRGGAGRRKAAAVRECRRRQAKAAAANAAAVILQSIARRNAKYPVYKKQRRAAIALQAWHRGKATRAQLCAEAKRLAEQAEQIERASIAAACTIQSLVRGAAVRAAQRQETAAAVAMQAMIRGAAVRAAQRKETSAAVAIQAMIRGAAARARAATRRDAAVVLQAWARGTTRAREYRRALSAACTLQAWSRGVTTRERLAVAAIVTAIQHQRDSAAMRLQAWARGTAGARRYRRQVEIIVWVQARQRGLIARARLAEQREAERQSAMRNAAAVVMQAHVRAKSEAARFRRLRVAAITVQAWRRGTTARARMAKFHRAAIALQAWVRAAIECRRYVALVSAAVAIQKRRRGAMAVARYRRKRDAIVTIQSAWRARQVKRTFAYQVGHATRLQAWWRSQVAQALRRELARVVARELAQKRETAAVRLQSAWRARLARNYFQNAFHAVVRLQARSRGVVTRARLHRERLERERFEKERVEHERQMAAERALRRAHSAALVLQMWQRGRLARAALKAARALNDEEERRNSAAAVVVQSAARGRAARRAMQAKNAATIVLQTAVRGRQAKIELARKRSDRDRELRALAQRRFVAAVRIQSIARAAAARAAIRRVREDARAKRFERENQAAVKIQVVWRGGKGRARAREVRERRAHDIRAAEEAAAATIIQASMRSYRCKTIYRRSRLAAVAVQALWRGVAAQKVAAITRAERAAAERAAASEAAAVRLQAFARKAVALQRYRTSLSVITALQANWRGVAIRARLAREAADARQRRVEREEHAAVRLQAIARGRWSAQRANFVSLVARRARAAVEAAAWWRMTTERSRFSRARKGTVAFQALWRGRATRRTMEEQSAASRTLGTWWRAMREVNRLRTVRRGIVVLQSIARGRRGRREVVALWRELGRRYSKDTAATVIQAVARGRAVRRAAGAKVAIARARLAEAEERRRADPSLTLGAMLESALKSLEHGTHLTSVIRACITLELSTRYSRVCCQVMAESRAPQVLYDLVRGLNRSPPHQKILKYTITTFRNVAQRGGKLPGLMAAPPVAAETFLDLLQMYRERQEVFLPTVRLLQQLVSAHKPTKDICNEPKNAQRLESICDILARKAATESKGGGARGVVSPVKGRAGGGGIAFGGVGVRSGGAPGRSARSLKAMQLLMQELRR